MINKINNRTNDMPFGMTIKINGTSAERFNVLSEFSKSGTKFVSKYLKNDAGEDTLVILNNHKTPDMSEITKTVIEAYTNPKSADETQIKLAQLSSNAVETSANSLLNKIKENKFDFNTFNFLA